MSNFGSKVKNFFQNMVKPPSANVLQAAAKMVAMKPHVPLIKFRGGTGGAAGHSTSSPVQGGAPAAAAPQQVNVFAGSQPAGAKAKPNATVQRPVIESYQLPPHLRRKPLSQEEVDYINRGGPA
jgi:hypothetical protein